MTNPEPKPPRKESAELVNGAGGSVWRGRVVPLLGRSGEERVLSQFVDAVRAAEGLTAICWQPLFRKVRPEPSIPTQLALR